MTSTKFFTVAALLVGLVLAIYLSSFTGGNPFVSFSLRPSTTEEVRPANAVEGRMVGAQDVQNEGAVTTEYGRISRSNPTRTRQSSGLFPSRN